MPLGSHCANMRWYIISAACLLSSAGTQGKLSDTETQYVAVPSNVTSRENLEYITSKPHVAGTAGDFEMAQYVNPLQSPPPASP